MVRELNELDLQRRLQYPMRGSFLQEQIFALTPFMLYSFVPFFLGMFLLDTTDQQWAFSLLPTQIQERWLSKILATLLEIRVAHFMLAISHFSTFHCITSLRTIQTALANSAEMIRSGIISVEKGYSLAKIMHLTVNIFNVATAGAVFVQKICNLAGGVVSLYFGLRLVFIQPLISLIFLVAAFNFITFYTMMWDNAFIIPDMIKECKCRLIVMAERAQVQDRRYWRRVSMSVPCIGVTVGGFRNVERDSTIVFMDFVMTNVASLLITF